MAITPSVRIAERKLSVKNRTILTGVPDNVAVISASSSGHIDGVFVGVDMKSSNSRHVVPIGALRGIRFLASFRFKLWWMAQRMGAQGREIPLETQFLLLENNAENQTVYIVFLPLIEGSFRACLQGNGNDEIELCLESGDEETRASSFTHSLFIASGTDPFAVVHDAITAVKFHLKTFRQRHEKQLPEVVNLFGWCTWDAFYQDVTQEGVQEGIEALTAGGIPPKFVIIDDGWQSVGEDEDAGGGSPLLRITEIKENRKFRTESDPTAGIKSIVSLLKERMGLRHVYVWHAITGYWGGVRSGLFGSVMKYPSVSTGVISNEPTWKTDPMAVQGLGLVNPDEFYDEFHAYLAEAGVDGVKVDVQCIIETLGSGLGGRVDLTRKFNKALDSSIAKNFAGNGCIACMSHNTDSLYCSNQTAVVRASDDFFPRDPMSHTIHVASVAYNSIFVGEFMQPDWDMFHSLHPAAEYHASARAISGGPVYVSDAPGKHDFDLLKKLVLPDGSVLRALLPGRPTRDCLFSDPTRDGISLLKIWNVNKYTGVLGVYNCQGAAWSEAAKTNAFHDRPEVAITGRARGGDVELIGEVAGGGDWDGDCAVYGHKSRELVVLHRDSALAVTLNVLEHDVFTVTPVKTVIPGLFRFAPIGLIDMFNSGGAIDSYEVLPEATGSGATVVMKVRGCGVFGAYSSSRPKKCRVDGKTTTITYDSSSGLATIELQIPSRLGEKILVEFEL